MEGGLRSAEKPNRGGSHRSWATRTFARVPAVVKRIGVDLWVVLFQSGGSKHQFARNIRILATVIGRNRSLL
jgi:hypothetical protein